MFCQSADPRYVSLSPRVVKSTSADSQHTNSLRVTEHRKYGVDFPNSAINHAQTTESSLVLVLMSDILNRSGVPVSIFWRPHCLVLSSLPS